MIGHQIDNIEYCAQCDKTEEDLVATGLTMKNTYVSEKWNPKCDKTGNTVETSPTQCAYECRKKYSGICPVFDTSIFEDGKCWRENPNNAEGNKDTDCTKPGYRIKGPYSVYIVQNIGKDFNLNSIQLLKYIILAN